MTKYRVGDEVTLRGTIGAIDVSDNTMPLAVTIKAGGADTHLWVSESEIATHTPKPREFKIGDMVRVDNRLQMLEVVAIKEKYAILWDKKTACSLTFSKEYLSYANEAE